MGNPLNWIHLILWKIHYVVLIFLIFALDLLKTFYSGFLPVFLYLAQIGWVTCSRTHSQWIAEGRNPGLWTSDSPGVPFGWISEWIQPDTWNSDIRIQASLEWINPHLCLGYEQQWKKSENPGEDVLEAVFNWSKSFLKFFAELRQTGKKTIVDLFIKLLAWQQ